MPATIKLDYYQHPKCSRPSTTEDPRLSRNERHDQIKGRESKNSRAEKKLKIEEEKKKRKRLAELEALMINIMSSLSPHSGISLHNMSAESTWREGRVIERGSCRYAEFHHTWQH